MMSFAPSREGEEKMTSMRRSTVVLVAAALALVIGGCQKQAAVDAGAIEAAIKADEKKWNEEFKAKDQEALVAHYADDAYFVAPGMKPASGSTEIRKAYSDGLHDKNFEISFASDKVDASASGDLAYARGHFSEKYTDPKTGKVMSHSGSYVTVYKKQQDGSWKAVEDFAAADASTQKELPPEKPATRAKMVSF
jgi:uncharacterized protein (TIGR02246 family)